MKTIKAKFSGSLHLGETICPYAKTGKVHVSKKKILSNNKEYAFTTDSPKCGSIMCQACKYFKGMEELPSAGLRETVIGNVYCSFEEENTIK